MPKAQQPRKYAEGTEVSADKSRSELEAMLKKHGAAAFAFFANEVGPERGTHIVYRMRGMMIRQRVAYPVGMREPAAENEYKRRWRALLLITKAKLEIVASGESTFEREFLSDLVLPDGRSVAEVLIPQLAESYESGEMPNLLMPGNLRLGAGS